MNWKLLVLAAALVGLAVAALVWMEPAEGPFELTILHTNDLHAHYESFEPWGDVAQGGVARLKTLVDGILDEEDDVLFLDAGDQFQGTLYFTVGGGEIIAEVMNALGYDGMCLGNHEFDAGPAELAAFIEEAEFPVLSANTVASSDPDLEGLIYPYAVYDFGCEAVAVVGLTTEHTATASSPGPHVRFLDAIETAQSTVDELREGGIDIILALTHLGYARDLQLAGAVDGIDVIVGGHSHTLLDPYPTVTESASGEPVLIVTAQEWGKWLGRLDVTFSEEGVLDSYVGQPIFVDASVPEDPELLGLLAGHRPQIDALMSRVVGKTETALNGARENVRVRETNLGNLICDAMLWKAAGLGATIAIQNGGGIRASVPAGEVMMGNVLEVLPYGNQLTTLALTGAEVAAAIENGVSQVEEEAGRFPHVGGVRYTFDPALDPGARVTLVEIQDAASGSYVPIDPAVTYTIATNNYLAGGGDGYEFSGASERYDTGWLLSDALAEYLGEAVTVAPQVEGRIVEAPGDEAETTEP